MHLNYKEKQANAYGVFFFKLLLLLFIDKYRGDSMVPPPANLFNRHTS
jgi:hypothetical protein